MKIGLQTWGSEGDIRPFTALAAGLVKAGHEITLVVTDNIGRDYSAVAKKYGFKLIPVGNPEMQDPKQVSKVWRELIDAGNPLKQAQMIWTTDWRHCQMDWMPSCPQGHRLSTLHSAA